ncbi:choice-of-anchor A family protein [Streptacidiphilus sp. N1-10]|uniref:Choice-of-anchor A family protein n=1 Tax=Streptacidiphilus jeojiensis TaxID=3229225 RepID=A0ABV6XQN0_9ACTN
MIITLRSPLSLCVTALGGGLLLASTAVAMTPPQLSPAAGARAGGYSGNPVDGSKGFGVVVENNAVLGSTESEGPIAIGGNLSFGPGYNVSLNSAGGYTAPGDSKPTALLVNGSVDFAGSSPTGVLKVLSGGYLKVGSLTGADVLNTDGNGASVNTQEVVSGAGYNSVPRIELNSQEPLSAVGPHPGLIDFDALFAAYRQRSTDMAACPTNVTLLDGNGVALPDQSVIPAGSNIKIHLSSSHTNVLHLTGAMLNNISELTFLDQPSSSGPLMIVVDTTATGGKFVWNTPNMAGLQKTAIPSLLWNFPDATDITVSTGDSIEGTIYAPRALLTDVDPSNIEGDIIVRSLVHGPLIPSSGSAVNAGELHYFPFTATISCTSASPSPANTDIPTPSGSASPTSSSSSGSGTSSSTPAPSSDENEAHTHRPDLAATGTDPTQPEVLLGALALTAVGTVTLALVRRDRGSRHR